MMQNISIFYKFVSEDETMANFQRKYGIHHTSAPTHNRRPRKYARPTTFSLPGVGEVIDYPVAPPIEPLYTTLMTRDYCGNYIHCNGTLERILTDNGYIQGGEYYFYIKDYQGNIRVVLNQANVPVELNSYYPYGALMAAIPSENQQPYKYGAKELDRQNGIDLYDFHARQMDPLVGRFTSIDKKSEKFYSISPYTYCAANPIAFVDPTGNSTRVVSLGDDKYRVESVNLKDNDKNIYVKKNGKIFSIGVTPCLTTFYASKKNGNGGQVVKSIINLKDNSGTDFQKQVKLNPDIAHYVNDWGRSGHKWDFKNVGYSKEKGDKQLYQYRGMPIGRNPEGKKIICSARDLGNWAAGYISGVNGISWSMSRMAFDLYEMISNRRIGVEENSTVNAEFWGWSEGNSIWKNQLFKLLIPIDW